MIPVFKIPKTHATSGVFLKGFGHVWEPVVNLHASYTKNSLPPPFEAFGDSLWRLEKCEIKHDGECHEYTCKEATTTHEQSLRVLKQFNVLFGVTRNKKFAAELRAFKKQEKEDEEKEEEEEEEEEESESESESEFESETESETEQDDEEEDDEEEEEEAHKIK
jgi:hypothetical protein